MKWKGFLAKELTPIEKHFLLKELKLLVHDFFVKVLDVKEEMIVKSKLNLEGTQKKYNYCLLMTS